MKGKLLAEEGVASRGKQLFGNFNLVVMIKLTD